MRLYQYVMSLFHRFDRRDMWNWKKFMTELWLFCGSYRTSQEGGHSELQGTCVYIIGLYYGNVGVLIESRVPKQFPSWYVYCVHVYSNASS